MYNIDSYDIIFMDIDMDDIDGCVASKIIKSNNFSGKIIATTGNILAKKENRIDQERYKYFDDVIIKPFDDTTILKILHVNLQQNCSNKLVE
jgi:CheY-like chemotaxis protein